MSLGKTKNKTERYSDIYSLDWEMNTGIWYFNDYYEYYDHYGYGNYYYSHEYETFSVKERVYMTYVQKSFGRVTIDQRLVGEFIDMDKIYEMGSVYYRERMLNRLLGIEKLSEEMNTTLGDYFPKK